jgi:uncharacterized protein YdhG (YjbR/CyaY superfamily)
MRSVVKSAALVEAWFDMLPAAQRPRARELQAAVLAAAPQLSCTVKWGNLLFLQRGTNAVAIAPHRSHANLQFFDGLALAERYPQLEGAGTRVRHLRCPYGEPLDTALVRELVLASVEGLP